MKNTKINVLLCLLIANIFVFANDESKESKEFTPSGKPFAKVFSNFHSNTNGNNSAFELTRMYFGYKYEIAERWSSCVNMDIGNPKDGGGLEMTAYAKEASVKYHTDKFSLSFGLIGLTQFKVQENFWDRRYIYKSFQDEHKLGASADLGLLATYKVNKAFSFDITIRNGEGYKLNQSDNIYNGGLGITLKPIDDLTIRGFYDISNKTFAQSTISGFVGYKIKEIAGIGVEYIMQQNHKYNSGENLSGISAFANYNINKKFQLFGRYDMLSSNTLDGATTAWNIKKDGNAIIAGIQYAPIKNIKAALNYQMWTKASDNTNDSNIYLNLQYSF